MRTFNHFPNDTMCPICGKGTDKPCTLIPVDGTGDGRICEAVPVHDDCVWADGLRFNREANIFYKEAFLNEPEAS